VDLFKQDYGHPCIDGMKYSILALAPPSSLRQEARSSLPYRGNGGRVLSPPRDLLKRIASRVTWGLHQQAQRSSHYPCAKAGRAFIPETTSRLATGAVARRGSLGLAPLKRKTDTISLNVDDWLAID